MSVRLAICSVCGVCSEGSLYERTPETVEMKCTYCDMWVYGVVVERFTEKKRKHSTDEQETKSKRAIKK